VTETTALGAAYLAGLATDFWESLEDIRRNWKVDRIFSSRMVRGEASKSIYRLEKSS